MVNPLHHSSFNLYEQDFCLCLDTTAKLLRNRQLNQLDYDNLIEEIEAMGGKEKHALESNLIIVLMHLLKYKYQPNKRSNSWLYTIREHRRIIIRSLQDSPSLNPYLLDIFNNYYQYARQESADETGLPVDTFPLNSPFTLENTLNFEFLPDENI